VVKAAVTVAGDSIQVDFAGTAAQLGTNLNCPFASLISASVSCLKAALTSPDIPFNDGALRPITVTAPKGSLLNPNHPAPVRARMVSASRAWNAVMMAISQAAPEQVIAQGFDTTTAYCLSWLGPEGWSVYLEVYGGGYGAGLRNDGCDAVDNPLSNCSNTPVEAMDQDFSFFRVLSYGLRADSGGRGAHRGGAGFSRSYEILKDGALVAHYSDRFTGAAQGIFGGGAGANGKSEVLRAGQVIALDSKTSFPLLKGDIVTISLGGGGGYGMPGERPTALIQRDLEDGIITPELAEHWAG